MTKKELSERDICTKFITPAIVGGGSFIVIPTLIYQAAIATLQWPTAATVALILPVVALAVVWAGMTPIAGYLVMRRLRPEIRDVL